MIQYDSKMIQMIQYTSFAYFGAWVQLSML